MRPTRAAATAAVLLAVVPAAGQAKTIHVPGDEPDISAAVDAASAGDTIQLAKGRYEEAIVVSMRLKFVGGKGVIWDGFFSGSHHDQLVATADGVEVHGISFVHGDDCVTITGDEAVIENCRFEAGGDAILIDGARARVLNNRLQGMFGNDIAIHVLGPDARIAKNDILYSDDSRIVVDAEGGGSARIEKNVCDSSQFTAIEVFNAAGPVIRKNVLRFALWQGACILAENCPDADIRGNQVRTIHFRVTAGIHVIGDRARVSKNVLENLLHFDSGQSAIRVAGDDAVVDANKVLECVSAGTTRGIEVTGDAARVLENDIADLGGSGGLTYAVEIAGDDATASKNRVDRLTDFVTYGVRVDGERATVDRCKLADLMKGSGIWVTGDDFAITRNAVKNCTYEAVPIEVFGSATAPGKARILKNKVSNIGHMGCSLNGNDLEIRGNSIQHVKGAGFAISGLNARFVKNETSDTQGAGFSLFGVGHELVKCRVKSSSGDGFQVLGPNFVLTKCEAYDCEAEGFDNGSLNTSAIQCIFKKSRLDYAGNGNMLSDAGTKYTTGGPGAASEIN